VDAFLDALTALVGRAAAPWLGMIVISSPLWLLGLYLLRQALQRRRAFKAFAAARQLEFVGTIASDARAPYTRFRLVRRQVLLWNVIEGRWDGLPIHLFDTRRGRRSSDLTMVIVTVEGELHRGRATEGVIAAGPAALIETNVDALCVWPDRRLTPSELAAWLSFATTLAKAMERDAKEAARFDTPDAPRLRRAMFGLFTAE